VIDCAVGRRSGGAMIEFGKYRPRVELPPP
jgi:hypothetical protein